MRRTKRPDPETALNPGLMGVIGAPTYPMLRDATQRTFFEILEIEEIAFTHRKAENAIVLTDNGSYIAFRSLDSFERLRGTNLAWFGVDELTYAKPDAWSRLEGRLRDSRAYRRCGFAAWTPKGFDRVWERFIEKPGPDYAAVQATPRENHYVAATGFYDSLERSYERRLCEQEVEGSISRSTAVPSITLSTRSRTSRRSATTRSLHCVGRSTSTSIP